MGIEFEVSDSDVLMDIKIISPSVFREERGSIWTSYHQDHLNNLLPPKINFKHDKFSCSKKNVLRGIHGDNKSWKLVSCVHGSIYQVVADLREGSQTYLKWQKFDLNCTNRIMILVPPGMGNAFYVNSSEAIYHYKLAYDGEYIDADEQFTISWNDARLGINWPSQEPILSNRDRNV